MPLQVIEVLLDSDGGEGVQFPQKSITVYSSM